MVRGVLLGLLALLPLATLFHRDDLRHWDGQRSAMSAPDEFSYLLMARHFLEGGGLSLQGDLGRDTFYPPGYPLLLAAWGKCLGLTAFAAHALNALLLCADTVLVYFLCRRVLLGLGRSGERPLSVGAASALALVIAGIFAANWHVLETSLLIMSEPAFMLVTFGWLMVALKWPEWHGCPLKTACVVLLAVAAWSIRGAGMVCVGATILYPVLCWVGQWRRGDRGLATGEPPASQRQSGFLRVVPLLLVVGVPVAYQVILAWAAPEKSLFAGQESTNSYPKQLLRGLLVGPAGADDPHPWLTVARVWPRHMYELAAGHLNDYCGSFVPLPREPPDFYFRLYLGKFFGLLGGMGFLCYAARVARRGAAGAAMLPGGGLLALYILFYAGLYLVWPFNSARFWSPIMPLMLVFAADAVMRFSTTRRAIPLALPAGILLGLLLLLSGVEVYVQLGNYARRLNYVSDALRDATRKIIHDAPDPRRTLVTGMGDDELYALAWYFSREPGGEAYHLSAPAPHVGGPGGRRERADEMLVRYMDELSGVPGGGGPGGGQDDARLYFFSYFPGGDTEDTLTSFRKLRPEDAVAKIFQKEAVAGVWEIRLQPAATQGAGGEP